MKACSKCREEKPPEDFYSNNGTRDRLTSQCRDCSKQTSRRSHSRRRTSRNQYNRNYYRDNSERLKAEARASYYANKAEAFKAYGGYVCACCGETEALFLAIDHVNGDGNKHRREIGARDIYSWLKANGFPEGFQVLCFNCNQGKRLNNNVCPHLCRSDL